MLSIMLLCIFLLENLMSVKLVHLSNIVFLFVTYPKKRYFILQFCEGKINASLESTFPPFLDIFECEVRVPLFETNKGLCASDTLFFFTLSRSPDVCVQRDTKFIFRFLALTLPLKGGVLDSPLFLTPIFLRLFFFWVQFSAVLGVSD